MSIDLNRRENLWSHTPNEVIQVVEMLVANMGDLVKLWARLIKMVSQLKEDAGRLAVGNAGFDGKVMATLEHIICELDSRDKTVSWHKLTPN